MNAIRASLAALSLANAQPALARQAACAPRAELIAELATRYGETRQGAGLQDDTLVMEIYASAESGSWTVVYTRPDGLSCAVASGDAWLTDERPAAKDAPA